MIRETGTARSCAMSAGTALGVRGPGRTDPASLPEGRHGLSTASSCGVWCGNIEVG